MKATVPSELLLRFLLATPEQQAAIERILGYEDGERRMATSEQGGMPESGERVVSADCADERRGGRARHAFGRVDGTGWPIPTQLIPLWQRADEVQEMLTALSRVKGSLRAAQENRDELFAEVNFSSALSQLDQAWTDIKTAKPFAVCPTCQGQIPDKCTLCRGRGPGRAEPQRTQRTQRTRRSSSRR